MSDTPSSAADRYARLPKHLAAAGVLFHDERGRVLLVKPAYRSDTWLTPGGGMDPAEYPWETARREVKEELDIDLSGAGRLLGVDWTRPRPDGRPALVLFLFDGGLLTTEQAEQRIRLPADELLAWQFTGADEWSDLVLAHVARRLDACLRGQATGSTVYLQDGRPHPNHED